MKTIILFACAVFAPMVMQAQMLIAPTPEYRRGALSALTESERALVAEGIPLRIDARNAILEPPRSAKRSTANLFKVSWADFFAASNLEAADRRGAPSIEVVRTKTLTRTFVDNGNDSPEFTLEIEWRLPSGQTAMATGEAVGPTYKAHGDVRTQPESVRSSNYAFYAAYLKAMAQIAAQVQPGSPPPGAPRTSRRERKKVNPTGQPKHGEDQRAKEE